MSHFAARLAQVQPSAIIALAERARKLTSMGRDTINLAMGEPDFDTPQNVKRAAIAAIEQGHTRYTRVHGTADLREAIRAKFQRDNQLPCSLAQITVASGAKLIIFNAMMATLDPGDEVIIPAPYWTSYPDIVRIAGGQPVFVPCTQEHGFKLRAPDLQAAISPRTRWVLLNSPNNPTGSVYRPAELQALGDVLLTHKHVRVLSDDIYEHLTFDDAPFATMASAVPALADRTLTMNGVSKAYAMTGWRLGYAAGPESLIKAMGNVQQQSSTHACSIAQAAALEALTGPQGVLTERRAQFQQRRDLVVDALDAIDGLSCARSAGAFFAYPSCAGVLGRRTPDGRRIDTDRDFVAYVLDSQYVATVPGVAFGLSPHFRVSFATSEERLREACQRIERACAALA